MQRHAFLIMAHNNWYTLQRLIQVIDAPWNDIYLHIDRKSRDFPKDFFLSLPKASTIRLTKRHSVTWGDESQVRAEMELFKTAFKRGPYHYYHFLSGSDLPLLNAAELYHYFEDKNCNYLHATKEAAPFLWRLKNYINVFRNKWIPAFLRKKLNILSEIYQYKMKTDRLAWLQSHYPIIGKGHNWCDLTQAAVEKLIAARRDIRRFTRFTHCSDEMYKQIILLNTPENVIGPISGVDIHYVDWSESDIHPRTLRMSDYDTLISCACQRYIFARKFDEKVDQVIIDKVYQLLSAPDYGR